MILLIFLRMRSQGEEVERDSVKKDGREFLLLYLYLDR